MQRLYAHYLLLLKIIFAFNTSVELLIFTPHAQRERGKVIGVGVHIYVCGQKKKLNRTLTIDSPFQTYAVGLLIEFID